MGVDGLAARKGCVLAALAALLAGGPLEAQPVFRSGVDLVNFGVTVVDRKGALVADLKPEDFVLVEEGRPQRLDFVVKGDDAAVPLRIGLLFDTSGSMEKDIALSRSAAIKFLNTLTRAEDMTLVDFDTEVRVTRYQQADFPRLVERIRSRKPDGYTALYDALGVYLDGAGGDDGQKILVIYTDGGDTRSAMTFGDCIDLVKASDVTVYGIGFLENQSSVAKMEQRLRLQQLAEATGGQAYFPTSMKDLDGVYAKIVEEIAARYTLGYQSSDATRDGAWRSVEIRVARSDLKGAKIRTRKGYFAPLLPASKP
jgi:Ca-activated chloride channel family protein